MSWTINEDPNAEDLSHLPLIDVMPLGAPTRSGHIYPHGVLAAALMSENFQKRRAEGTVLGEVVADNYRGRDHRGLLTVRLENVGIRIRELLVETYPRQYLQARIEPYGPQGQMVQDMLDQKIPFSIGMRAATKRDKENPATVTDIAAIVSFDILPH